MYIAMDMGTSNTRVWLCDKDRIVSEKKSSFGAKNGLTESRYSLFNNLKCLLSDLIKEYYLSEKDIECIITSGMSGSEFALCDVPHICSPCDQYTLTENIFTTKIPEITDIPICIIPGVKTVNAKGTADIMRGEETELVGILSQLEIEKPCVIVLPGTHNKIIRISKDGEITSFCSTISGEMLDLLINNSILAGTVSHTFELSEIDAKRGMEYALDKGINAAIFHVRVMSKNGASHDSLSSFLYGAVLGQDINTIICYAHEDPIYVGGKKNLQSVYSLLLENQNTYPIDRSISDSAVLCGIKKIYKTLKSLETREHVKEAIEKNKIIAIVRNPERDTLIEAAEALYRGGIRLMEVTFDRSGKYSASDTCDIISKLSKHFEGRMYIGAGTVTEPRLAELAINEGALFIISPNCDPETIELTKKNGCISIPAAFTATEITSALNHGADYIKLFPADQATDGYVKAITAPLSDAKLLAVGGVTAENAKGFINSGFLGVGVGSNLYNKKLIQAKDFDGLAELAKKFVDGLK